MSTPHNTVRLVDLFTSFFKLGVFTFGGGYAMIPLIEREIVARREWIRQDDFLDLLTLAQSIPGPIALNSAAFIGYQSRGYLGALISVLGIVVPSFAIILAIAIFFVSIRNNAIVDAAFRAMRPVVVALIIAPTLSLMKGMSPLAIATTILSMAAFTLFALSPGAPLFGAIVVALIWTYFVRHRKNNSQ